MLNDDFGFFVPFEAIEKADNGKEDKWIVQGIASTNHTDRQGENLIPEGFDYSYFLESGYLNWHHQTSKMPSAIIGEPMEAKLVTKGLFIKGYLYKNSKVAKEVWDLAKTLNKNSSTRRLGFSIEGKVVERDETNPNKVLKAKITGCAITHAPINPNTFLTIVKAMNGENVEVNEQKFDPNVEGGGTVLLDQKFSGGEKVTVYSDGKIVIDTGKAMTTESASAVMPESVEGSPKPKKNPPPQSNDSEAQGGTVKNMKEMSKAEAYEYIFTQYPNLTSEQARMVYKKAKEKNS